MAGYDFTENEDEELQAQRDDARAAQDWSNLTEKAVAGELNALNTRVSTVIKQLVWMISDNDYKKTKDLCDALVLRDLSPEGWMSTFVKTNKEAFLKNATDGRRPDWVNGLLQEEQKLWDALLPYYQDVKKLVEVSNSLYQILMKLPLEEGFRLMRIKDNFEAAGFDEGLYRKIDEEIKSVSDLLNRSWEDLEKEAAPGAQSYIDSHLSKVSRSELEKGYREIRTSIFQEIVRGTAIFQSLVERPNGYYSVKTDMLTKAAVIDSYTYKVSQTDNLKDSMQRIMDECKKLMDGSLSEAEEACTTQAAHFLTAAFRTLLEAVTDFAEFTLDTYVNFKEGGDLAPYCFMKKMSAVSYARPKYSFNPNTSDPWDSGTYIKDLYREAADAIGAQCRLFVYDHGVTFM